MLYIYIDHGGLISYKTVEYEYCRFKVEGKDQPYMLVQCIAICCDMILYDIVQKSTLQHAVALTLILQSGIAYTTWDTILQYSTNAAWCRIIHCCMAQCTTVRGYSRAQHDIVRYSAPAQYSALQSRVQSTILPSILVHYIRHQHRSQKERCMFMNRRAWYHAHAISTYKARGRHHRVSARSTLGAKVAGLIAGTN